MCGRFYIDNEIPAEELQDIIAEVNRKLESNPEYEQLKMHLGEIFPTNIVPVLAPNKQHLPAAYPMKWGFAKFDGKGVVINARSESALIKPMFQKSMLERRCLIPASNYFEWQTVGSKKVMHALRDPMNKMIYMAGVYRYEADKQLPVFVILTRAAAQDIRNIHDRMPVILGKDAREAWLSDSADITGITGILSTSMENIIAEAV